MSKIISVRASNLVALATATIGWSNIDQPDEMFNNFQLDYPVSAITGKEAENLEAAFDEAEDDMLKELEGAKVRRTIADVAGWAELRGDTPDEGYGVEDFGDYVRLKMEHKSGISKRTKKAYDIRPRVYDARTLKNGKPVLLSKDEVQKLLPGSVVRPIVEVGLYSPKPELDTDPRVVLPSVKLNSLILVKPRFGGSGGGLDDSMFDGLDLGAEAEASDIELDDEIPF